MERITIQKNTVQETLLIPLYARKLCTEIYPDLFQDDASVDLVKRLDYDFSKLDEQKKNLMWRFGALETAMRQTDLAIEVNAYLAEHPQAAIVNLGCGLDQTGENCSNGTCTIYNLDFPEVIAVRNQLLPSQENVKNIAVDLNDLSWTSEIDASKGILLFAAGVFYYFTKEQMKHLIQGIEMAFAEGVLVFDAAGKKAVKKIRGIVRGSGIQEVEALFAIEDLQEDLQSWLLRGIASERGYMLGYRDLNSPSVSWFFRKLAKLCDTVMKMRIIKITWK